MRGYLGRTVRRGGGQRGGWCSGAAWRCWRLGRGRMVGRDGLSLSWALEVGGEFDFYSAGSREPLQGFEKNSDMSGLRLTQDDCLLFGVEDRRRSLLGGHLVNLESVAGCAVAGRRQEHRRGSGEAESSRVMPGLAAWMVACGAQGWDGEALSAQHGCHPGGRSRCLRLTRDGERGLGPGDGGSGRCAFRRVGRSSERGTDARGLSTEAGPSHVVGPGEDTLP